MSLGPTVYAVPEDVVFRGAFATKRLLIRGGTFAGGALPVFVHGPLKCSDFRVLGPDGAALGAEGCEVEMPAGGTLAFRVEYEPNERQLYSQGAPLPRAADPLTRAADMLGVAWPGGSFRVRLLSMPGAGVGNEPDPFLPTFPELLAASDSVLAAASAPWAPRAKEAAGRGGSSRGGPGPSRPPTPEEMDEADFYRSIIAQKKAEMECDGRFSPRELAFYRETMAKDKQMKAPPPPARAETPLEIAAGDLVDEAMGAVSARAAAASGRVVMLPDGNFLLGGKLVDSRGREIRTESEEEDVRGKPKPKPRAPAKPKPAPPSERRPAAGPGRPTPGPAPTDARLEKAKTAKEREVIYKDNWDKL